MYLGFPLFGGILRNHDLKKASYIVEGYGKKILVWVKNQSGMDL